MAPLDNNCNNNTLDTNKQHMKEFRLAHGLVLNFKWHHYMTAGLSWFLTCLLITEITIKYEMCMIN